MLRTFGRHLVRRSLGSIAATLALVMVVFLAERMTGFVEMLIERRAPLGNLPLVLALTAPEIIVTAMPIAVLIGAHRALMEARDGGETVVMAGAGVGPFRMISSLFALGAVAVFAAIVAAGFLDPMGRAARDRLFLEAAHRMAMDAVEHGLPSDRIETLRGHTFVSPAWGAAGRRPLLVFPPREGDGERIVAAANYDLRPIEGTRRFALRLDDVSVMDLQLPPAGTTPQARSIGGSGYRLGTVTREIDLDEPLRDPVLADQPQYRTLVARVTATGGGRSDNGLREAEIVARACLSLIAVLTAAIAASFADGRRRFFALPAAGAAMVVFDTGLVRVVRAFQTASADDNLMIGAATVGTLAVVLAVVVLLRQGALVAPRGGRS